jgi:hypothetical protein
MKAYIAIFADSDEIEVRVRAEGPGGTIGDALRVVRPGESAFGKTYDELVKYGSGLHDLSAPPVEMRRVGPLRD